MSGGVFEGGLRIAVEGCGHGELNTIYAAIERSCKEHNYTVDLLIICGDFQSVRNWTDLQVMACPAKYRQLADFHEYYSGARTAPIPTIFIGGNHEASSYLQELYHGGWVSPNIYYLGAAGVINVGGLRIGGLSGIYQDYDYNKPRNERLPYTGKEVRSIYHVRKYDTYKLWQVKEGVDVMMSHDWPLGVEYHGDVDWLFSVKNHFKSDSEKGELGSPPARSLMGKIRPKYWFSGHMHVKFAAIVDNEGQGNQPAVVTQKTAKAEARNPNEISLGTRGAGTAVQAAPSKNPDELDLDLEDEPAKTEPVANPDEIDLDAEEDAPAKPAEAAPAPAPVPANPDELDLEADDNATPPPAPSAEATKADQPLSGDGAPLAGAPLDSVSTVSPTGHSRYTRFLALDKASPVRDFLQILTVPFSKPPPADQPRTAFYYDPEWLAITRLANSFPPHLQDSATRLTSIPQDELDAQLAEHRKWVEENVKDLKIPENFVRTAPVHVEGEEVKPFPDEYNNPQTEAFCQMLGMENWVKGSTEEFEAKKARWRPVEEGRPGGPRNGGGRGGRGGGRGGRGRGGH